jgi:hypothetical protein
VTAAWTPSASSVVSMVSSREAFCTPILTSIWRTSLLDSDLALPGTLSGAA